MTQIKTEFKKAETVLWVSFLRKLNLEICQILFD